MNIILIKIYYKKTIEASRKGNPTSFLINFIIQKELRGTANLLALYWLNKWIFTYSISRFNSFIKKILVIKSIGFIRYLIFV